MRPASMAAACGAGPACAVGARGEPAPTPQGPRVAAGRAHGPAVRAPPDPAARPPPSGDCGAAHPRRKGRASRPASAPPPRTPGDSAPTCRGSLRRSGEGQDLPRPQDPGGSGQPSEGIPHPLPESLPPRLMATGRPPGPPAAPPTPRPTCTLAAPPGPREAAAGPWFQHSVPAPGDPATLEPRLTGPCRGPQPRPRRAHTTDGRPCGPMASVRGRRTGSAPPRLRAQPRLRPALPVGQWRAPPGTPPRDWRRRDAGGGHGAGLRRGRFGEGGGSAGSERHGRPGVPAGRCPGRLPQPVRRRAGGAGRAGRWARALPQPHTP